jgi:Nucleotidyl transferase AbiEii toxin, Type IV TA system
LRVLLDGLPVFERYELLLAGGYALRAHEILHRPSQDLDFATGSNTPLPEIAEHVQLAFQAAGYGVRLVEATGRYARLALRLPDSGDELEMDLLKEALEPCWVTVQLGPAASVRALSLDDTVGLVLLPRPDHVMGPRRAHRARVQPARARHLPAGAWQSRAATGI